MRKTIRYRIYGMVDFEGDGLEELLDRIREYGDVEIVGVEMLKDSSGKDMPDVEDDFQNLIKKEYERIKNETSIAED